MSNISDALNNLKLALSIVGDSTYPTLLTTIGIFLIGLSAYYSFITLKQNPKDTPRWQKVLLFSSLAGGVLFVVGGGASALLHLFDNSIRRISADQAIQHLEDNAKVDWLIRLIPHRRGDNLLALSALTNLGPPHLKYIFVAPYDELKGRTVSEAVKMVGGSLEPGYQVSAVIFRANHLYPANARGMLQVVQKLEKSVVSANGKRLIDSGTLSDVERQNLVNDDAIVSWSYRSYRPYYENFCKVAQTFRCDPSYAARDLIGSINLDWHPLGFSMLKKPDICENKFSVCKNEEWSSVAKEIKDEFGARTFLIDNRELNDLGSRYLIEFDDPGRQVIPEIGPG
jgi:hypothetical protein